MLLGEWVSPRHIPVWGSEVGGEHVQWNSHLIVIDSTKPTLIKKKFKKKKKKTLGKFWLWDRRKTKLFPIVMESAEEIPLSKLSLFKIEKILSKSLKPKTVKKKTNLKMEHY